MLRHNIILSVDPSVNHVGFAILQLDTKEWEWDVVETDKSESLPQKCLSIAERLKRAIAGRKLVQLVMEYPAFFTGTKGAIAAQKGYTIDLAFTLGFYFGTFQLDQFSVFNYKPMEWKGQKPKKAIEAWFLRTFGTEHRGTSDHAYEAAMMLYWHAETKRLL